MCPEGLSGDVICSCVYNQSCHSGSQGLIAACVCSALRGLPVAGRVIVRPVAKSQSRVVQGLSTTPQHMDKPLYQGAGTTNHPLNQLKYTV